jgi:hypothetical protein
MSFAIFLILFLVRTELSYVSDKKFLELDSGTSPNKQCVWELGFGRSAAKSQCRNYVKWGRKSSLDVGHEGWQLD